jgi:hypothetical protein
VPSIEDVVSEDGWVTLPKFNGVVTHFRIGRQDGRWIITDVYVQAPEVTASVLQQTDVSRILAMLNSSGLLYPTAPDESLDDLTFGDMRRRAERMRRELADRGTDPLALKPPPPRPTLQRPDGKDTDQFYALVARAYRDYAPRTRKPAVEMAKEAEVPVTTVHRWIREARRRGHLPPSGRG